MNTRDFLKEEINWCAWYYLVLFLQTLLPNDVIMFPKEFFTYLSKHTLTGVRAGDDREKFTKIWMVSINERVFARSWNKKEKSWFTAFLKNGKGEIQYGEHILKVKAVKLDSNDPLHQKINQAYIEKYTQPGNIKYAEGFSDPDYANYTIELIPGG